MDDSANANTSNPKLSQYKSPKHALIWSFRRSRDHWKRKYYDLKARDSERKKDLAALADLKAELELMRSDLIRLHAENQELRSRLAMKR